MLYKLLILTLSLFGSASAFAHGMEGVARIRGADCSVFGKEGAGRFGSIVARVTGDTAMVWVYNGPRNAINPKAGLAAEGKAVAYSMVGFPQPTSETVVINLDENVRKVVGLPRLVVSTKITNANTDLPANGFLSNPMSEEDDITLRCYMDLAPTQEDLFDINPEHVQRSNNPSICSIEFKDNRYVREFTHGCTATVIGENKLLSAAHCQEMYAKADVRVRCGQDPTYRQVTRWVSNSDYRPKTHPVSNPHDVSVLTLDSSPQAPVVAMEADTKKIERLILENKNCRHYGLGTRIDGTIGVQFTSRYHEPHPALGGYDYVKKIFEMTHMIANDPSRFMRSGDSGGPIVCENERGQDTIVGVHSFLSLPSSSAMSAMTSRSWQFIQSELRK